MAEHSTTTSSLRCVIVTPETSVLVAPESSVAMPLYDGEAGLAPGRSPLFGRFGYGELRVRIGNGTARFYVGGGFVQVADNIVSVLTNRAVPAERLNSDTAG